jgi:small subunit ribosomal protein S1
MQEAERALEPWEVPPGEAYWQALLEEGEYQDQPSLAGLESSEPEPAPPEKEGLEHGANGNPQLERGAPDVWDLFSRWQAEDRTIELEAIGYNRGGLLVEWERVTGFVPASQLCEMVSYEDEQARSHVLADRVGCTLKLKVIELDADRERLILSERAAHQEAEPALLDQLTPGDIRSGHITNLCAFGAFVDLGGVEGLVHISEISWGRVSHPAAVLENGQKVEVYVLNVDRAQRRVGLSLKRLRPDPWDTVDSRYQIGQVVQGVVTNVVRFGAFVRIEEGLEGLIHVSDLGSLQAPDAPLEEGDSIDVCITSIEGSRHRIGLSLA